MAVDEDKMMKEEQNNWNQIINRVRENNEKICVNSAINVMNEINPYLAPGMHIEHYESTQNKYYFDGQAYDFAELKVLVDAISSSKFDSLTKCSLEWYKDGDSS